MTDNEIIKALRCCAQPDPICKECPYYDPYLKYPCADQLKWAALNLIDSQKAEIERLENSHAISKKETKRYVENYKRQKKEIEEYRNIIERATEGIREVKAMLPRELAKERSEAVKEFAERLKEAIRDVAKIEFQDGYYYLIGVPLIDNLVKEFTEEKT